MREGIDFRVVGDALYVPMIRLTYVLEQASRYDPMPFTRTTIHNLLNANLSEIIRGGGDNQPMCVVFNLTAIETQMGLTEKPWLALKNVSVGDSS